MKSELSKKNPHYITKHCYYEMKHFCLRYLEFQLAYLEADGYKKSSLTSPNVQTIGVISDPTYEAASVKAEMSARMELIRNTIRETDAVLYPYILRHVTQDMSYDSLVARGYIPPCCKDYFYDKVREFFWRLSKKR